MQTPLFTIPRFSKNVAELSHIRTLVTEPPKNVGDTTLSLPSFLGLLHMNTLPTTIQINTLSHLHKIGTWASLLSPTSHIYLHKPQKPSPHLLLSKIRKQRI